MPIIIPIAKVTPMLLATKSSQSNVRPKGIIPCKISIRKLIETGTKNIRAMVYFFCIPYKMASPKNIHIWTNLSECSKFKYALNPVWSKDFNLLPGISVR